MKTISKQWRLPDVLWGLMNPLLPPKKVPKKNPGGRPHLDFRTVADGIFYVLRTGCQWKAVSAEFGSGPSLHRYFQKWSHDGIFFKMWNKGLLEYDELQGIDWSWQSIDSQMNKSPLGGEKNRAKSYGQIKARKQKVNTHRRRRYSTSSGCGGSECT